MLFSISLPLLRLLTSIILMSLYCSQLDSNGVCDSVDNNLEWRREFQKMFRIKLLCDRRLDSDMEALDKAYLESSKKKIRQETIEILCETIHACQFPWSGLVHAYLRRSLANYYLELEDYSNAEKEYSEVLLILPEKSGLGRRSEIYTMRALCRKEQGNLNGCIQDLKKVLESSSNMIALKLRGDIYFEDDKFQAALAYYKAWMIQFNGISDEQKWSMRKTHLDVRGKISTCEMQNLVHEMQGTPTRAHRPHRRSLSDPETGMPDWRNPNFYKRLDIGNGATDNEIKRAFRQQSKLTHPDRVGSKYGNQPQQNMLEARDTLLDRNKRAAHNRMIFMQGLL